MSEQYNKRSEKTEKSLGLFSSFKNEPSDDERETLMGEENSEERHVNLKKKLDSKNDQKVKRNRMGCCSTFFAILKAYTTMNIFALPIGFKCGGWLFSPIVLIVACFFELVCALKLV